MLKRCVFVGVVLLGSVASAANEIELLRNLVQKRNQLALPRPSSDVSARDAQEDRDREIVAMREKLRKSSIPAVATLAKSLELRKDETTGVEKWVTSAQPGQDRSQNFLTNPNPVYSFQHADYEPYEQIFPGHRSNGSCRVVRVWGKSGLLGALHFNKVSGGIALLHIAEGVPADQVLRDLFNQLDQKRKYFFYYGNVFIDYTDDLVGFFRNDFYHLFEWGGSGSSNRVVSAGPIQCQARVADAGNAAIAGRSQGQITGGGQRALPGR